jgi:hypothetical protein
MTSPGEEKAWETLQNADPSVICRNAGVSFDNRIDAYLLRSFCWDFTITPKERTVTCDHPSGRGIVERYGYFLKHSCLWYMVQAKDIPIKGKLIKPSGLRGGEMFFRGSHVIPLDNLVNRYGDDRGAFLKKGGELCAEVSNFGDASLRIFPMPRIPVTLILWLADEEFPARVDLLLDASCEIHLPIDIIWSTAMMSVLVMR